MEKSFDFHDEPHVPPPASAPSYEEAMKCSTVPIDQLKTYPNLVEMQSAPTAQMPMPVTTQQPLATAQQITPQSYVQSKSVQYAEEVIKSLIV